MFVFVLGKPAERAVFWDNPIRDILIVIGSTIGLFVVGVVICRGFDAIRGTRPEPRGFDVIQSQNAGPQPNPPPEYRGRE